MRKISSKGQVWIETMIYILIGLSLLGTVLVFVRPKIQEYQDNIVLEQTLEALNQLDEKVQAVYYGGQGNTRTVDFQIKRGRIDINAQDDKIIYTLENSRLKKSEPGRDIKFGEIVLRTEEKSDKRYDISLILNYSGKFNLLHSDSETPKTLVAAPSPYKLKLAYQTDDSNNAEVNIEVTS